MKFNIKRFNIKHIFIFILLLVIFIISYQQSISKNTNTKNTKLNQKQKQKFFNLDYHKTYKKGPVKKNYIFVSIASYRDDECVDTVNDIFRNASDPSKIILGICQQHSVKEPSCIPSFFPWEKQIKMVSIPHTEARGPTYARYICSHLWSNEEYFLQIDSHTKFQKNWDVIIKKMYKKCPPKSILTHYPPKEINKHNQSSYTCTSHYENNFHIISEAHLIDNPNQDILPTPYASAGFLFGYGIFLHEVPFDPYLPYLFQGEEILLATRLFTNGWDLYNLSQPVCTHNYERKDKPHFWDDQKEEWKHIQKETHNKYYYLLQQYSKDKVDPIYLTFIENYGMGSKRTLKDWFDFAGIDPISKKVQSRCKMKYNIQNKKWENN